MKRVCMIGSGYVGLVTGTCLAELGHRVICVDKDESKISILKSGKIPIYEPGLEALARKNTKLNRLSFTSSVMEAVQASDFVFIAVNTPPLKDGGADLSFVEACTREVARSANKFKLLVEKSTVPVKTGERIKKTLEVLSPAKPYLEVASNPEFLREGSAVKDFLHPDRIIVGVQSQRAENMMRELYAKIKAPIIVTDINSAELIKHASNSFLSLKISYINSIAQICEKVGADVEKVAEGMGYDARINRAFLNAGIGYGGSCFPKDVSAFIKIAEEVGFDFQILKGTAAINHAQRELVLKSLKEALWTFKGKNVGILGLSFKPDTDDLRNAPAIDFIQILLAEGAVVKAYDPVAMDKMKVHFPQVEYCASPYKVAEAADALLIVTEWEEFRKLDLNKIKSLMNTNIVVDGRNIFDPMTMKKLGFTYHCVGRSPKAWDKKA